MKRFLVTFCLAIVTGFAGTWNGTIVDLMCKGKDVANHTRQCAIDCAKGGYGIVTSDGRFYKLDETGNTKALAALKKSTKEKDLRATITGTMDGDVIKVDSLALLE